MKNENDDWAADDELIAGLVSIIALAFFALCLVTVLIVAFVK